MDKKSSQQINIGSAVGVLATAFLASMSVSSFFFIQPGDANASNSDKCASQGIVRDSATDGSIEVEIKLSEQCPDNDAYVYGIGIDGVAYEILNSPVLPNGDYSNSVTLEFKLEDSFTHYIVSIEGAFSARIEAN